MKVIETGYYVIRSDSRIDSYGSLYKSTFNPLNPSENLLSAQDDDFFDLQFRFNIHLNGNMTCVLVITTYELKETGQFSLIVQGPSKVILERLSEYITCWYYIINSRKSKVYIFKLNFFFYYILKEYIELRAFDIMTLFNWMSIQIYSKKYIRP